MALKAGYYGVKKQILDELDKLDGILPANVSKTNKLATQSEINDIRSEQAVMGAYNSLKVKTGISLTVGNGTIVTNSDSSITINATTSSITIAPWRLATGGMTPTVTPNESDIPKGKYRIVFVDSNGQKDANIRLQIFGTNGALNAGTEVGNSDTSDYCTVDDTYTYYYARIWINTGVTFTNKTMYPMLISADDTRINPNYVPYAMTNKELTDSAADLTASASDQKTAINAIIAAATGAADFAAFKTAMEAITPVTRSLSIQEPETRSLDPEPEPETKTTKRSTKKTEATE